MDTSLSTWQGKKGIALSISLSARAMATARRSVAPVHYPCRSLTGAASIDGVVDLVISHPRAALAEATMAAMVRALDDKTNNQPTQILLPFDIFVAENV